MNKPPSNAEDSGTWTPVRRTNPSASSPSFPKEVIVKKNTTGSWLSALEQPPSRSSFTTAAAAPPHDRRYRHYVGAMALNLQELLHENKLNFRLKPSESFQAYPLMPQQPSGRHPDKGLLSRSENRCPITAPYAIFPQAALFALQRETDGAPSAGSLRYSWLERGYILQGRLKHDATFSVQVRHHTKLEHFHEIHRPVYCINFRTDTGEILDLRLMALLHTELGFLEAAAQAFARKNDSFSGLPIIDHQSRMLIDERVIRRAAYHYSQFQRNIPKDRLYSADLLPDDSVRYAHFLVSRSHLPEFSYDPAHSCFRYRILEEDWLHSLNAAPANEAREVS